MKKVLLCLLLCLFTVTFSGCTSAQNLTSINTAFSSIYFAIDCSESGLEDMTQEQQAEIKNKIQTLAATYIEDVKLRYYSVLDSMVQSNRITSSERVLLRNHLTPYVAWNENSYIIEFRFYTTLASRIFITSCQYSGAINEEHAFSTTTTEKFSQIFSKTQNGLVSTTLENYFATGIEETLGQLGQEALERFKGANYYYFFATQNPRLHAVGQDEEVSLNGGKIFCYYASETGEELTFEFYVVQANQFAYYLLALAIVFVFVAIYLVIIYFKKPKNTSPDDEKPSNEIKIEIEE